MLQKDRSKLCVLIVVIGLLLLTLQGVSAEDKPVFNIGVLDGARGSISNGARLAVQGINDAGGIRGADGTQFNLGLVIEPSASGASFARATQALHDANVIAVLGPQSTDDVINGLTQLQSLGVPVITPATGDTIITSDTTGMIFRSRAEEALQGQVLASYLINENHLSPVATVQLDVASTASVVGFTTAATTLGVTPNPALILRSANEMTDTITALVKANPAAIVAYGTPTDAATLYTGLRTQGWAGVFAYNQANDPDFQSTLSLDQLSGIIDVTTWPFTANDPMSMAFLNTFIHAYGLLPNAVSAASYDSVMLIANALTQPGNLHDNLAKTSQFQGVQGVLKASNLVGAGELSNNVAITRLGDMGGQEVLARYQGNERLPAASPLGTPTIEPTATLIPTLAATLTPSLVPSPLPSPTPQGVTVTIKQTFQNVRSGPGDNFDILGQMNQGDQAAVIGASLDYSWVVVNFRGQQGWLAAYLATITGDLRSVPVIPSPPTPTPAVTATPSPAPFPDLIIVSAVISPNPITSGQNFTVNITVGNIGGTAAGPFVVSGTFPPSNLNLVGSLPGLAPGQTATLALAGILNGSGTFTTSLQMDATNQVNEGVVGEQNNIYNLTYSIGGGSIAVLNQGSKTLNLGDTLDLEGNNIQGDINWNKDGGTLGIKAIFGAKLGVLGNGDFNAITYDSISPSITTRDSIPNTELSIGTLVGIRTADGHRGVMQVTSISDTQIGLNYRVYNG